MLRDVSADRYKVYFFTWNVTIVYQAEIANDAIEFRNKLKVETFTALGGIFTHDRLIASPVLFHMSYQDFIQ